MKNKFLLFAVLIVTIVSLASCAASRSKYGCPMNQTVGRFKG